MLSSAALAPEARRPKAAGATSICWKSFIERFLTQEVLNYLSSHILLCSEGIRRNKTAWACVSFDRFSGSICRF
jgi:hypothetical protein